MAYFQIISIFAFLFFMNLKYGFAMDNSNFALTDKVAQGNFAYAKLFAFADDGATYKLTKRSTDGHLVDKFAFKENGRNGPLKKKFARIVDLERPGNEFAFAFQKRSTNSENGWELEKSQIPVSFAKFAKRQNYA